VDQPATRPLPTQDNITQNKRRKTSIHQVEIEPTTLVFEWAKTVHALDHAATAIGTNRINHANFSFLQQTLQNKFQFTWNEAVK
jgi:hypothetical protein